jgi:hypothetical protein
MDSINIKPSVKFLPNKLSQWALFSKDDFLIWIRGISGLGKVLFPM